MLVFKAPVQVAQTAIVSDLHSPAIIVVNILSLIFDSKYSIVLLLEILLIIQVSILFIYEHLTDVHDLKCAIVLVIFGAVSEIYLAG